MIRFVKSYLMMYSIFKKRAVVIILSVTIGIISASLLIVFNYVPKPDIVGNILSLIVALATFYIVMQLLFGELRSKAIKVMLSGNNITKWSFLGIGLKSDFSYTDVDGYKTSIVYSRSGDYEYLYLISNSKRVIKISEFYHENYQELKLEIIKRRIKNLGNERWSILNEIEDIFTF